MKGIVILSRLRAIHDVKAEERRYDISEETPSPLERWPASMRRHDLVMEAFLIGKTGV